MTGTLTIRVVHIIYVSCPGQDMVRKGPDLCCVCNVLRMQGPKKR